LTKVDHSIIFFFYNFQVDDRNLNLTYGIFNSYEKEKLILKVHIHIKIRIMIMVHPKMGWVELKIREIRRKKKIEIDNNRYTNNVIKKVERDRKNAMWLKMRFKR